MQGALGDFDVEVGQVMAVDMSDEIGGAEVGGISCLGDGQYIGERHLGGFVDEEHVDDFRGIGARP